MADVSSDIEYVEAAFVSLGLMRERATHQDDQIFRNAEKAALKRINALVKIEGMPADWDFSYNEDLGNKLLTAISDPKNQKELQEVKDQLRQKDEMVKKAGPFGGFVNGVADIFIANKLREKKVPEKDIPEIVAKTPQIIRLAEDAVTFVGHMEEIRKNREELAPAPAADPAPKQTTPQKKTPDTSLTSGNVPEETEIEGPKEDEQDTENKEAVLASGATSAAPVAAVATTKTIAQLTAERVQTMQALMLQYNLITAEQAGDDFGIAKQAAYDKFAELGAKEKTQKLQLPDESMRIALYSHLRQIHALSPQLVPEYDPATNTFRIKATGQPQKSAAPVVAAAAAPKAPEVRPPPVTLIKQDLSLGYQSELRNTLAANSKTLDLANETVLALNNGFFDGNDHLPRQWRIEGLKKGDGTVPPDKYEARIAGVFKNTFKDADAEALKNAYLLQLNQLRQLPFGGKERMDAYAKSISDMVDQAFKNLKPDKSNIDDVSKQFAASFVGKFLNVRSSQPANIVIEASANNKAPQVDRSLWKFGAPAKDPNDPSHWMYKNASMEINGDRLDGVLKAYRDKNINYYDGALTGRQSGFAEDLVVRGENGVYLIKTEEATNLFTAMEINVAKMEEYDAGLRKFTDELKAAAQQPEKQAEITRRRTEYINKTINEPGMEFLRFAMSGPNGSNGATQYGNSGLGLLTAAKNAQTMPEAGQYYANAASDTRSRVQGERAAKEAAAAAAKEYEEQVRASQVAPGRRSRQEILDAVHDASYARVHERAEARQGSLRPIAYRDDNYGFNAAANSKQKLSWLNPQQGWYPFKPRRDKPDRDNNDDDRDNRKNGGNNGKSDKDKDRYESFPEDNHKRKPRKHSDEDDSQKKTGDNGNGNDSGGYTISLPKQGKTDEYQQNAQDACAPGGGQGCVIWTGPGPNTGVTPGSRP